MIRKFLFVMGMVLELLNILGIDFEMLFEWENVAKLYEEGSQIKPGKINIQPYCLPNG